MILKNSVALTAFVGLCIGASLAATNPAPVGVACGCLYNEHRDEPIAGGSE